MKNQTIHLNRRGFSLGAFELSAEGSSSAEGSLANWHEGKSVVLREGCLEQLPKHSLDLQQSDKLYRAILDQQECDSLLSLAPYQARLDGKFESLGCVFNEADEQEIETLFFDAVEHTKIVAEDLWIKVSWLSFHDDDASLRFRFSFGVDHQEDVAADENRQLHAATLTEGIFPESRLITQNKDLNQTLSKILDCPSVKFVERIIYFNAPGGGAYLHHDRERGHAGVVYAQLSGNTIWLALPRRELQREICAFINQCKTSNDWPTSISDELQIELSQLCAQQSKLAEALESFRHSGLIHLINETQAFIQQLIANGHSRLIKAGDLMLLPQESDAKCCWHSVFCADDEPGQALSFAIRAEKA
ncbi:MAG: hypothetical protein ACI8XV_001559 [Arenicella sp.]|jgi:hypothetical protein